MLMKSAVFGAVTLGLIGGAAHAQGLNYSGTPQIIHSGSAAIHIFIPGNSATNPSAGWWGIFTADADYAGSGPLLDSSQGMQQRIVWNASGTTVPCNPAVCGAANVPGMQGVTRGFGGP